MELRSEAARDGIRLLAVVMGELMEDAAPRAIAASRQAPQALANELAELGADLQALGRALAVLARLSA